MCAEHGGLFLGTWHLIAFSQNGQPHPVYGRAPTGTIRYDADGNMAVQIMPDRKRPSEPSASAPAETQAVPGYIAYFGRYRVAARARTVTHDRVGNVTSGEPRAVVRHYEFLPNGQLALTLAEDPTAQVLWQREH
jgi:lipocalin-like protein